LKLTEKSTNFVLSIIGFLFLFVGIVAAFFGPAEIYCYYLFSEGSRFHFQGFGFGSFLFGNITMQIVGYYIIAILFIPLGYGHLKRQSWIRSFSLSLIWVWFIFGIILIPMLLFIIVSFKQFSIFMLIVIGFLLLLSYTILPILLIRFYQNQNLKSVLKSNSYLIDKYPIPILTLTFMYLFYFIVFHFLLLHKGIFPLFGTWLIDVKGFFFITPSIIYFVILILGTLIRKLWAWWAALFYFLFVYRFIYFYTSFVKFFRNYYHIRFSRNRE